MSMSLISRAIRAGAARAHVCRAAALLLLGLIAVPLGAQVPTAGGAPVQPAAPVQTSAAPAVPALTPEQQAEVARLKQQARALGIDSTSANAQARLDMWEMVRIVDRTDVEAEMGHTRALGDLDAARRREEAQKVAQDARQQARDSQAADRKQKMASAEAALNARNLDRADQLVGEVLEQSPDDPRALSLRDGIRQAQEARRFARRMQMAAVAMLALAVGIVVLVRRLSPKSDASGSGAQARKAVVKVVDGVGRGRLMPVEKEIFRIGAADGERPEEKNDLIISDSAGLVSRYHCTILRKGRDYFLLDSSLNGTKLNDEALERGEHHPLEDGDEFVVAGAARLKFLHT